MHKIQDHLLLSKGLIEKLAPSKAVKELTEIKEQTEITLDNSQKIFEETYHLKYLEFKSYLTSLQKPEDLTKELCDNITLSIKEKFTEGIKKSANQLYGTIKQHQSLNQFSQGMQTEEP